MYPKALKPLDPIEAKLAEIMNLEPQRKQRELVKLLERHPSSARGWTELAELHFAGRRTEETRHAAQRALELDLGVFAFFSPGLRSATSELLTAARQKAEAEAERLAREAWQPPPPSPEEVSDDAASRELARVMALPETEHLARLEVLTRRFPSHGRTWLALAEANMAQRRIQAALDCCKRAISLEADLEFRLSRQLEQARQFHDRDRHAVASGRAPRPSAAVRPRGEVVKVDFAADPAAAQPAMPGPAPGQPEAVDPATLDHVLATMSEDGARGVSQVGGQAGFGPMPGQPAGFAPGPAPGDIHEVYRGVSLGRELAVALDIADPARQLDALHTLLMQHPDHPAVLYHFALHAALEGHTDHAQQAGERLKVTSPIRYRQLFEMAEKHFAAGHKPKTAMPTMMVQAAPEPPRRITGRIIKAQPAPQQPWRTVALQLPPFIAPTAAPTHKGPTRMVVIIIVAAILAGVLVGVLLSVFN